MQSRTSPASDGPLDHVQTVLRVVRRYLSMDVGFISEFRDGDRVFRFTDGATAGTPIVVGGRDPLEKSFCHYVARGMMPGLMRDAAAHPVAAEISAELNLPVGAHLSIPLTGRDGTAFGTICCFSFTPDQRLTTRDLDVLRIGAEIVTSALERGRDAVLERQGRREHVIEILAKKALAVVYQPIYRVADDRLMGFESLSRFDLEPRQGPDRWFADAAEMGLGVELEFLAVAKALEAFPALDPGVNLTINLSPDAVLSERFAPALAGMPLGRIVIELTEHTGVAGYDALRAALAPLRAQGLRLAIDDVGAGHSTFQHVLDLAPELIKLDRSLVRGIDGHTARRALAEALTMYGRRMGCEVVAEGVETAAEYAVLREIGITKVQGYHTGRPMPLAEAALLPLHRTG